MGSRTATSESDSVRPVRKAPLAFAGVAVLLVIVIFGGIWWHRRPSTAFGHYLAGQRFEEQGISSAAMVEYRAAVQIDKTYAEPYLGMAQVEAANGNLGRAADLLGTVLYYHPDHPHIQCRRAQLYGTANRFEMALTVARDAVKIEPNCAAAHNDMGMLYDQCGDSQNAALELGRARTLAPDDEALSLDYARVLVKAGQPDDAFDIVDGILKKTKLYKTQANYLEGWILSDFGPHGRRDTQTLAKAIQHLGLALVDTPSHTASLQQLGIIYLRTGNLQGAQSSLEKALKAGPDTIEMLDALIELYTRQNNPELAAQAKQADTRYREALLPLKKARLQYINHPEDLDNDMLLATHELDIGNKLDAFGLVKMVHEKDPTRKDAVDLYAEMKQ